MADENEYSTITPIHMQPSARSDYRNLKQPVWTNVLYSFPPLQNCRRVALILYLHWNPFSSFYKNIEAVVFAAVHHTKTLNVCSWGWW